MCGITRRLRMGAPRQALCAQGCHLVVFLNGTISTWCVCVMADIDTVFSVILSSKAVVKNVRHITCPFQNVLCARQDGVLYLLLRTFDGKQPPGMSTIKRNQMTQRCEYAYSSTWDTVIRL